MPGLSGDSWPATVFAHIMQVSVETLRLALIDTSWTGSGNAPVVILDGSAAMIETDGSHGGASAAL